MMENRRRRAWLPVGAAVVLFASIVSTASARVITVTEPWVLVGRGGKTAEAYMELRSSDPATLVAVTTEVTTDIAIHPPGTSRAKVADIPLPAGELVRLVAGGYRFTLAKLNRSLKLGDRVAMTITIQAADSTRQDIALNAEVRLHSPTEDHLHPHTHAH